MSEKLPIPTEHDEQAAFFAEVGFRYLHRQDYIPELHFAVVNGFWAAGDNKTEAGRRRKYGLLNKYRAEGMKKGVADTHYLQPRGPHPYCVIEFKRSDKRGEDDGGLEPEQIKYLAAARDAGAYVCVCYSCDEALEAFADYMALEPRSDLEE